jgi:hypothetical protein
MPSPISLKTSTTSSLRLTCAAATMSSSVSMTFVVSMVHVPPWCRRGAAVVHDVARIDGEVR